MLRYQEATADIVYCNLFFFSFMLYFQINGSCMLISSLSLFPAKFIVTLNIYTVFLVALSTIV
jgi:hypothetical protein